MFCVSPVPRPMSHAHLFMLPKSNRLPHYQIRITVSSRQSVASDTMKLTYKPNGFKITRFVCIVPMSVDKRATVRNRIRRLVSESVRYLLPDILPGYDICIMARVDFSAKKQKEVEEIIRDTLGKTGILIKK